MCWNLYRHLQSRDSSPDAADSSFYSRDISDEAASFRQQKLEFQVPWEERLRRVCLGGRTQHGGLASLVFRILARPIHVFLF